MREVHSDVVVVGGGTAGCVVAARVSEDADTHVTLLEWGGNDEHVEESRYVRRWLEMLEGDYDLVMGVVRRCHMRVLELCPRVITSVKIDDRKGAERMLERKVASVEKRITLPSPNSRRKNGWSKRVSLTRYSSSSSVFLLRTPLWTLSRWVVNS